MRRASILRLLLVVALLAIVIAVAYRLPSNFAVEAIEWVRSLGVWGPIALGVMYVPAAVLMFPGLPLTLGAGFAFDLLPAIIAVSIGSTAGAGAAFLVGRTLARGIVEKRIAHYPRFIAIDAAIQSHGFKIVLLTRLSPVIPFNVSNYAFGLTKISFGSYFLASWIGMLPATILYVYLGHTAGSLAALSRNNEAMSAPRWIMTAVGLLATVMVTVLITRIARRALDQAVADSARPVAEQLADSEIPTPK